MDELLKELQALVDKYSDDAEPSEEDAARMAALTDEINKRRAAQAKTAGHRAAAVAAARKAIGDGSARRVDSVPLARSANAAGTGAAFDTTDYGAAATRAWVKDVAERSGVMLAGGNDLTEVERAAQNHVLEQRAEFTHTTANTDSVIPVEIQNQIVSLIDNTAVLYGDIDKSNLSGQFEIVRHKAITKGDAGKTAEGAAPTDIEQNEWGAITLTGEEIKKTVEMSRKMSVQSLTGFEQYIVKEVSARLAVACNAFTHERVVDTTLGMASGNKIQTAGVKKLTKGDVVGMLALLKTFGNPASKGVVIYANNDTIWNYIAMIEDANNRSYFVNEASEDPTVQGRIFGKIVKCDDSIADGTILAGYPDLFRGNLFDGPDVTPYIERRTQKRCFDGYVLFDGALTVPQSFAQLTIKQS